jgi:Do/DeqQ family serine protease
MKRNIAVFFIALFAGILGAYVSNLFFPRQEIFLSQQNYPSVGFTSEKTNANAIGNEDFVAASAAATPCVVYITTESGYNQSNWFDWFFHGRGGKSFSSGSGVIFSEDGYIITNNHVVNNAEKIEVVHEKKSYSAKLIGKDPSTDLAVLKIEGENLPAIRLGSSQNLKVGEWVLAVGNPFNLNSTVTAGIVSAKARHINVVNSQFPIESFIQTDAAINPGNSGGALVNIRGELVGINTAILSQNGGYIGYGFAVPVDIVGKVVKDIIKYGEVQKAFFGADVSDINASLAKELNLKDFSGAVITYIEKEGAAEKSGLRKGDVIIRINDYPVFGRSNFDEYLSYFSPGDKIKVLFRRETKTQEVTLTLTNREGTTERIKKEIYSSSKLGADLEAISKMERNRLGVESGVRVHNVRGGFFSRLGINEGFVITSINGKAVKSPQEVEELLEKARGNIQIEGITRNGVKGYYNFYF